MKKFKEDNKTGELKIDPITTATTAKSSNLETENQQPFSHQFENYYSNNQLNINLLDQNDDDFINVSGSNVNNNNNNGNKNINVDEDDDNSLIPRDIIEYNINIIDYLNNNNNNERDQLNFSNDLIDSKSNRTKMNYFIDLNMYGSKSQNNNVNLNSKNTYQDDLKLMKPSSVLLTNTNDSNSNEDNSNVFVANNLVTLNNFRNNRSDTLDNIASDINFCFEQSSFNSKLLLNEISKINFDKYFEQLLLNYINVDVS